MNDLLAKICTAGTFGNNGNGVISQIVTEEKKAVDIMYDLVKARLEVEINTVRIRMGTSTDTVLPREFTPNITHNKMTEQLKQLRLDLDGLAQLVTRHRTKSIQENNICLPLFEVAKSLYLAKAWAGKLLGELGGTSPYQNDGKRKDVADIEPTDAKQVLTFPQPWKPLTHIEKLDWLRQAIQEKTDTVQQIDGDRTSRLVLNTREQSICRTQIWTHLVEARLHLGFELERLRESEQNN